VGLGLNATDSIIRVPQFPPPGGKVRYSAEELHPGGQVAVALAVCRRFGFSASYTGSIGDDSAGEFQHRELTREGIDLSHLVRVQNCASLRSYIFVDETAGERTIVYQRPERLALSPDQVDSEWVASGRILHVDGHDAGAAARAAEIAREHGVTVSADLSNIYDHAAVGRLLASVDYLISSQQFPTCFTGIPDPVEAIIAVRDSFGVAVAGLTLGCYGALLLDASGWHYAPGFDVTTFDTTGAGDVFHGGMLVALLRQTQLDDALEFACALAALNCTALGARGHIASDSEISKLRQTGRRVVRADLAALANASALAATGPETKARA
jgi:sulfofructose kinase